MWKQVEMWDGTYSFADLCEVNLLLEWKEESIRIAREKE
jgi:hypothetical protein